MRRLTAAGMALIAVCYGLARFAYGLFVPAFRAEFGLNDTPLGAIAALSYVGYCFAVLAAAAAVARHGARVTATTAGRIAAAGMVVVASSPNSWTLAVGGLVAGSSTGVASPPLADAIARNVRQCARHDRAQAIVNAGPGVGIGVSGPIALVALGNWRAAWLVFAAIAAAVSIWVAVSVPRRATRTAAGGGLRAVAGVRAQRNTTVVSVRLHPDHPAAGVAFGFVAIAAGQAFAAPVVAGSLTTSARRPHFSSAPCSAPPWRVSGPGRTVQMTSLATIRTMCRHSTATDQCRWERRR
jgi:predicted MFS family arabinose efflux permease